MPEYGPVNHSLVPGETYCQHCHIWKDKQECSNECSHFMSCDMPTPVMKRKDS